MRRLVIVGGGFAGVWAALGALKMRKRHACSREDVTIALVSRDRWLTIRPRLYEASLDDVRVSIDAIFPPASLERVEAEVTGIDPSARTITIHRDQDQALLHYDALVFTAGSYLHRPPIAGVEHAFSVDTYADASALQQHLAALPTTAATPDDHARFAAVVVGAGFTGIETATELPARLSALATAAGTGARARVVLVERASGVAPDLSAGARERVEQALAALRIETRVDCGVVAIDRGGVTLSNGESIRAATTVWTGGFRASSLAAQLSSELDASGRVPVDPWLRVHGIERVFAAGDAARAMADATQVAPMSCQFAIPMGELAGANAVADLLGVPATRFEQPEYVTCLDLGEAGALFMQGWERDVRLSGSWAKLMKQTINTRLIYPPRARHETDIMGPRTRSAA